MLIGEIRAATSSHEANPVGATVGLFQVPAPRTQPDSFNGGRVLPSDKATTQVVRACTVRGHAETELGPFLNPACHLSITFSPNPHF